MQTSFALDWLITVIWVACEFILEIGHAIKTSKGENKLNINDNI